MPDPTSAATHDARPYAGLFQKVLADLAPLASLLPEAIAPREAQFLSLGVALQDVTGDVGEIVEQAEFLIGLTSQEALDGFAVELHEELQRIQALHERSASKENERTLLGIHANLEALRSQLERFKRIVKHLTMLGISTRIESARLGADGKGFGTLADDVEKLAVAIERQTGAIQGKTSSLETHVTEATGQAREMLRTQEASSQQAMAKVSDNLETIAATTATSQGISRTVEARTRETQIHISQAVSSLQFHDITRQQVEHVEAAVQDAMKVLTEQLHAPQQTNETDEEIAHFLMDISSLQAKQLTAARDVFYQAVEAVGDQLRGMAAALLSLAEDVQAHSAGPSAQRQDARQQENAIGRPLASVERDVGEMMEAMGRFATQGMAMGNVMQHVISNIAEMSAFLEDVEEVGASIELIALNASVKAAHTGSKGAAMGVLAQSIQTLAHEARSETEAIAGALADIGAASDILHANAQRFRESVQVDATVKRLEVILQGLKEMDTETSELFSSVVTQAQTVASRLEAFAAELTMHEEVRRILGEAADVLEAVARTAAQALPEGHAASPSTRLEAMLGRYTMEIERQIHRGENLFAPSMGVGMLGGVEVGLSESGNDDPLDGVEFF